MDAPSELPGTSTFLDPEQVPKIVSVDDHVIEPADVWTSRLPSKYSEVWPRTMQERGHMNFVGGVFSYEPSDDGELCDWWLYEDLKVPQTRLSAAAGFDRDDVKVVGITYEEMRKGCWDPVARLEDMDANWTEAQMCFPSFPRFCGQTFMEAKDKELSDLCVKAYNDWMVEEWCGGSDGRLIPLTIVQLWDADLAAAEVMRNAARDVKAVCFSEIPPYLGLPSIHTDYWEPLFRACAETNTVINMHIGSSSKMPSTSTDAPAAVGSTLTLAPRLVAPCQPGQTIDCNSEYACIPNLPPSRPTPDCLNPPNGASLLRCMVLIPTLPERKRLATFHARDASLENT